MRGSRRGSIGVISTAPSPAAGTPPNLSPAERRTPAATPGAEGPNLLGPRFPVGEPPRLRPASLRSGEAPTSQQPFHKDGQRERTVPDAGAHLAPCRLPRAACWLRQALCTVPKDDRLLRLWVTLHDPVEPPAPSITHGGDFVCVQWSGNPCPCPGKKPPSVFSPGPFLDPDAEHLPMSLLPPNENLKSRGA